MKTSRKNCAHRLTCFHTVFTFAALFDFTSTRFDSMENISNSRGKGYCILYIFMGLFFFTALVLMLYNRNFILDFPK